MSDTHLNDTVSNPATARQINQIGFWLLVLALVLLYMLITSWPVLIEVDLKNSAGQVVNDTTGKPIKLKKFDEFNLFGFWLDWAADKRLLFTVVVAGAVGSMAPVLTSVATYVGNARFSRNWIWWYILRAPIGIGLALLFYFIIRGGLLMPSVSSNTPALAQDATVALNIYGIAAFSALAGMFSKQASDKLEEVFNAVFTRKDPITRNDQVSGPAALKFEPTTLKQNAAQKLKITGGGFTQQSKVTVGDKLHEFKFVSADEILIDLTPDDVKSAGLLTIAITTGDAKSAGKIEVIKSTDQPSAPPALKIEPATVKQNTAQELKITGSGFTAQSRAMVGGKPRDFKVASGETERTIDLTADDTKAIGPLEIVVITGDKASAGKIQVVA